MYRPSGADPSVSDGTPLVHCKFEVKVFKLRLLDADSRQTVQST